MAIFAEGRIELGNSATVIGDIGTHSVKNQDVYSQQRRPRAEKARQLRQY